ncbi:MAG: CapA family protein [Saprospiraceae bacterium]|nr:CapA family protein [Saprospiraceae bacterium]
MPHRSFPVCLRLTLLAFLLHHSSFIIRTNGQTDTLRLIFAGDIMVHRSQILAAETPDGYDFEPCFEYVSPLLQSADLAIGNLELTMPGEEPYLGYPMFRCPEELSTALRVAGFDFMMTANNHSNDSGPSGVINTINVLEESGFYHTGTFQNPEEMEAYYPLIVYKKGFKLAFLNYTYSTNGIRTRPPTIVNPIDSAQISEDLRVARDMNPDAIIVMMHWGLEYQLVENQEQRKLTQQLLREGADLVIGAHPHVVQPARWEAAEGQKEVLVAYSLGNFISGQVKQHTDGGIMVAVNLLKSNGQTMVEEAAYIPVWRHVERLPSGKRVYRTLPIAAFEEETPAGIRFTDADRAAMLHYAKQTRKRVGLPEHPVTLESLEKDPNLLR